MRAAGSASILCVFLLVFEASCGSRSPLTLAEPCAVDDEARPCSNACGEGTKLCVDGFFGECVVAPVSRECTNACGSGREQCSGGAWGECVVARAERPCENVCGRGVAACTDGRWNDCQVTPSYFACANECGAGSMLCENGVMGECDVPIAMRDCESVCGSGHETCSGGVWGACDAPQPRPPVLQATIRDFHEAHPDFELDVPYNRPGDNIDRGIVAFELGPDDKPVYQTAAPTTPTTTGAENFGDWYHDRAPEADINVAAPLPLQLEPSATIPGFFVYHNDEFFPIDEQLFGNEGHSHNYHFTLEARTTFQYLGGEVFSFTGDDDMWVFVNRRLAIDLGGLHEPRSASVELDAIAASHGLVTGNIYTVHFFFAERHTVQSTFNIETSIADPGSCD